jgi:hypothetical protein
MYVAPKAKRIFCPILNKLGFCRQFSIITPNTNFHNSPFGDISAVPYWDVTRLVVAFGNYFAISPTTTTTTNNNNKYFLYSFLLLRSTAAYGQRITNKKDFFSWLPWNHWGKTFCNWTTAFHRTLFDYEDYNSVLLMKIAKPIMHSLILVFVALLINTLISTVSYEASLKISKKNTTRKT